MITTAFSLTSTKCFLLAGMLKQKLEVLRINRF